MCQTKTGEAGLIGWCHHAIGAWVGLAHLDTSFGPQLIRGLPIFLLGIWNQLFPNSSRALWLPSHLSHFEASQWYAPGPLSTPIYTPPQGPHPYALWGQQVTSPVNGGPEWALTSQSPILTPLAEDGEQFRCFGGRNEAFIIPLKRPPNSPAILISLSQVRWVTGQGGCVSSKAGLLYLLMTAKV